MPITLSEKIENAPLGSRLRSLFDDSSDDESYEPEVALGDSQKSQATWVGTQPPPGMQTQPEPYIIPRKAGYTEVKYVDERCPTPKPKRRHIPEIIIADTPDSVATSSIANEVATSDSKQNNEVFTSFAEKDLRTLKRQLEVGGEPPQSKKPARVSLSPTATKSRTNVSSVSSLEALAPPSASSSREPKATETKQKKRKIESRVLDVDMVTVQQNPAPKKTKKAKANVPAGPDKVTPNKARSPPKDRSTQEPPQKKSKANVPASPDKVTPIKARNPPKERVVQEQPQKKPKATVPAGPDKVTPNKARSPPKVRVVQELPQKKSKVEAPEPVPTKKPEAKKTNSNKVKAPSESDEQKPSPIEAIKPIKEKTRASTETKKKAESAVEKENVNPIPVAPTISTKTKEKAASGNKKSKPSPEKESKKPIPLPATKLSQKKDVPAPVAAAPVKKKKKRTFQDQVLAVMLFSCKAYNLKTLAQALNTTEIALQHLMLSLLDKKVVIKKEFASKAKTKEIYWANQESKAKEVIKLIPDANEVEEAKKELAALYKLDAENAKEMAILTQDLSNDEVTAQLQEMETVVKDVKEKLTSVRTRIKNFKEGKQPGNRAPVRRLQVQKTPAQLARESCPRRTILRINAMRGEWKSLKLKCMDFVDQLADGMEKKPKDVVKLLELETDEMEGVKMPPKHVVEPVSK